MERGINWSTASAIVILHLIVLLGLPLYLYFRTPGIGLMACALVLFFATGLSITAGYHRLYAHRAYEANGFAQGVILFFATAALQGSVAFWVHMHRLHHQFTDKEKDPHNIQNGFFHAHMGWLFRKYVAIDYSLIPDIMENKLTAFQHRHFHLLATALNTSLVLLFGALFGDYWGAFVIIFALRIVALHHATWFINSLAHTWGSRVFSREHSAVNNAVIAFFTFGEGYHNYHHVFPSDYRNGVRWYQYDPTKWLIWTCQKIGWTRNLKKIDDYTSLRAAINEDGRVFLAALKESILQNKAEYEQKITRMTESLKAQLMELKAKHAAIKALEAMKRSQEMKERKEEFDRLRQRFSEAWSSWISLTKELTSVPEISQLLNHHHHY